MSSIDGVSGSNLQPLADEAVEDEAAAPAAEEAVVGESSAAEALAHDAGAAMLASSLGASTYTVVPGDSLSAIADRHGVGLDAIIAANPEIGDPRLIFPG